MTPARFSRGKTDAGPHAAETADHRDGHYAPLIPINLRVTARCKQIACDATPRNSFWTWEDLTWEVPDGMGLLSMMAVSMKVVTVGKYSPAGRAALAEAIIEQRRAAMDKF